MEQIAGAAGVEKDEILGHDLFLYNRQEGSIRGFPKSSFPAADLMTCSVPSHHFKVFFPVRRETVWLYTVFRIMKKLEAGTKQGAASTFLFDTLIRVHEALGYDGEDYRVHLADSFMISADNAHAVHPNYTEKADPTNRPYLNEGIVLKFNANRSTVRTPYLLPCSATYVSGQMFRFRHSQTVLIWPVALPLEIFPTLRLRSIPLTSDFRSWQCIPLMRLQV